MKTFSFYTKVAKKQGCYKETTNPILKKYVKNEEGHSVYLHYLLIIFDILLYFHTLT